MHSKKIGLRDYPLSKGIELGSLPASSSRQGSTTEEEAPNSCGLFLHHTNDVFHLAEPPGVHLRQPGAAARAELDGAGAGGQQFGAAAPDGPGAARGGAQVVLPQHRRRRLPRHLRAHAARRRPERR